MASDRDTLVGMGFLPNRVDKALRATKNAGIQPAMDWLINHENDPDIDDPISESTGGALGATSSSSTTSASAAAGAEETDDVVPEGELVAQSLVCQTCGVVLRNADAAQRHALRTEHADFAESTQVIKPLTEEEKKAQLLELKQRLADKRAAKALAEKEEQKSAERIRRKAGQDLTEAKAKLEEKEMKKMVEQKRREKDEEKLAKAKIKAQIEADKAERARKKQESSAASAAAAQAAAAAATSAASSSAPKVYTEAKLQIRQPEGQQPIVHTFQASDKLRVVYDFVRGHREGEFKLTTTFPRRILEGDDLDKTLNELQLVPSSVLVVTKN
ncbi:ubiquitin-related domain-containing protein [Mortierella sp. GBAus27b]|nr:hypothetical protein BGX31_007883 [Mortierella sp. GBA43]KAI8348539.1 ubiquitin-related domain-containing protein [Mortierella sp. GBAus27b]